MLREARQAYNRRRPAPRRQPESGAILLKFIDVQAGLT